MIPCPRKDPDSIYFFFRSPKFSNYYEAKRPKFKTLRFKAMPKTIVARINPEITIIFVRSWRESIT